MFKTKLSTAIALVAVLSLLLVPAVYAAEDTTQGSFGAKSTPPTVDAINIYNSSDVLVGSMTPLTNYYYIKATITSANKLKHIKEVKVTLYYDEDGDHSPVPVLGNPQTCAIFTCTIDGPPSYTIGWNADFGGSVPGNWQLLTASCSSPNLELTTGDWKFAFVPGKVAHEAIPAADDWDAQGVATNRNDESGTNSVTGKAMDWYGEITVNTANVNWGPVDLGLHFVDAPNPETGISVTYLANGDYYEDVNSSENWTGEVSLEIVALDGSGGNPPLADSQFALMGNDVSDNTTWVIVTTSYNHINDTGIITSETPAPVTGNTLWLSLSAAGITPDTYDGEIHYQIANR